MHPPDFGPPIGRTISEYDETHRRESPRVVLPDEWSPERLLNKKPVNPTTTHWRIYDGDMLVDQRRVQFD